MYTPIKPTSSGLSNTNSFAAKSGVNKRDLPQLLSPDFALEIENYFIVAEGGLAKRKGYQKIIEEAGTDGLTLLDEWTDDIWIYGYGTNLKAYTFSTETKTAIKTDFLEASFSGSDYGNYFMVASPQDKVGRISQTLDYDAETGNFTVGLVVTGAASGATAVILELDDSGATGTLTLGDIVGVFDDDEVITDTSTGSADVNGTLSFTYTVITGAPKARVLKIIGANCHVGDLEGARDTEQYSDLDDGSNPPFDNWNVSTDPAQGDQLNYRAAGTVKDIISVGRFTVILAARGWWSYWTEIRDSAGVNKKYNNINMYREDKAGANRAIVTDVGMFYVNKNGVHQLVQLQQENIDYSKSEVLSSELLGNTYFEDVDFSNVDMTYLDEKNTLLITCRKDSDVNNFVIAYNVKLKSFSFFKGWSIARFLQTNDGTFGASANANKIYKLFEGNDDDGKDIWTRLYQEISIGNLNTKKAMFGQYIHGKLSPSSEIDIAFDIYDKRGQFIGRKNAMTWTPDSSSVVIDEYGSAAWGGANWGGDSDTSGAIENYAGGRLKIRNLQRLRVDITEHSKVHHEINFFTLLTKEKSLIRKRNLTY